MKYMSRMLKTVVDLDPFVSEFGEEKWLEDIEPDKEPDPKELDDFKSKALKCKLIALDLLNLSLSTNPSTLCPRDKRKVERLMLEWVKKPDEEVSEEFNSIVNGKLLL